ncbi:Transcription initiation factor TFIID subunit 3 [Strongyloides ratti]|uniref:Transcription initiation factor TFIID subunit 3 n=1 Tax=Strongyloides ratti TaxID=34506 RepID=A0A090LEC5_STRRB|nr:Transcription initiation factor TFIID subunit 3 [Strongyloides ratti]CEF68126.1 Transcription initiation factor TFIID subunit 3 [Strongyloides ratti]
MVECPMDPLTQGPEECIRDEVTKTMAIILEDIGFSGVTVEALTELIRLFETYFCTLSKRTISFANLANRAEPSVNDVFHSLKTMHNKVSEISDFVKQIDMPKRDLYHGLPFIVERNQVVSREKPPKEDIVEDLDKVEEENIAPSEDNEENQKNIETNIVEKTTKSKFLTLFKGQKVTDLGFEIVSTKKPKPPPEPIKVENKDIEESVKIKFPKRDIPKVDTSRNSNNTCKSPKVSEMASSSKPPLTNFPLLGNLNLNDLANQTFLQQLMANYSATAAMFGIGKIPPDAATQLNLLAQCDMISKLVSHNFSFQKVQNNAQSIDQAIQRFVSGNINIQEQQPYNNHQQKGPQTQQFSQFTQQKSKQSCKEDSIDMTIENVLKNVTASPTATFIPSQVKVPSKKVNKIKEDHSKSATDSSGLKFDTPTSSISKIGGSNQNSVNKFNDSSFLNISSTMPLAESTPKIGYNKEFNKQTPVLPKIINKSVQLTETDKEREKREKRERKEKKREKKRRKREERERLLQTLNSSEIDKKVGQTNMPNKNLQPLTIDVKSSDNSDAASISSLFTPVEKKLPIKLTFKRTNSSVTSPTVLTATPLTSQLADSKVNEDLKVKVKPINDTTNTSTIVGRQNDEIKQVKSIEPDNLNVDKKKHKKEKGTLKVENNVSFPSTNPDMLKSKIKKKDKDKKKITEPPTIPTVIGSFNDNGSDYIRNLKEKMAKENKIQASTSSSHCINKDKSKESSIVVDKESSPIKRPMTPISFSRPGSGPLDIEKEERGKSQVKNILNNFGVSPTKNKDKKEKKKKSNDGLSFNIKKSNSFKQSSGGKMSNLFPLHKKSPSLNEDSGKTMLLPLNETPPGPITLPSISGNGGDDEERLWICPKCHVAYNEDAEMVGCDTCECWYHFHCVGLIVAPAEHESWFCEDCLKKEKNKDRKRKNSKDLNKTTKITVYNP